MSMFVPNPMVIVSDQSHPAYLKTGELLAIVDLPKDGKKAKIKMVADSACFYLDGKQYRHLSEKPALCWPRRSK